MCNVTNDCWLVLYSLIYCVRFSQNDSIGLSASGTDMDVFLPADRDVDVQNQQSLRQMWYVMLDLAF